MAALAAPGEDGFAAKSRMAAPRNARSVRNTRRTVRKTPGTKPHVVWVQAESYVHPRRLFPDLAPDWSANFDALAREGLDGRLAVRTFGAYTLRAEYSVLTGLDRAELGVYGLNPYLLAGKFDTGSIARRLARDGYRTTCIHPNDARFFDRRRVMRRFGFERMLAREAFAGAERCGPQVSDRAVGEKIVETLREAGDAPGFAFAITIEAHGPWRADRLTGYPMPEGATPLPERLTPGGRADGGAAAYIRHLRNTDAMLGALAEALRRLDRPSVLLVYGDHPPALSGPEVEGHRDDPLTDFLLWRSDGGRGSLDVKRGSTLETAELGGCALKMR